MNLDLGTLAHGVLLASVYAIVGILAFGIATFVLTRILPFSIRKEIEEDQNVALGVILGAVYLGLAIIVAAAIHG